MSVIYINYRRLLLVMTVRYFWLLLDGWDGDVLRLSKKVIAR